MLLPYDKELVERDTQIPGLRILLDSSAFADVLGGLLNKARLRDVRAAYLRYKPATNCLARYEVNLSGTPACVYAIAYGKKSSAAKLEKAYRLEKTNQFAVNNIICEDYAIVIYVFPNDNKLKILTKLTDANARKKLFNKITPQYPELWESSLQTLRYKPERRYVAQLHLKEKPLAVIKVYTKSGYEGAFRAGNTFVSKEILHIPRILGCSDKHSILIFDWLEGITLEKAISDSDISKEMLDNSGKALAFLHSHGFKDLPIFTREREIENIFSLAKWLGKITPNLEKRFFDVVDKIARHLKSFPITYTPIHNDFTPSQILLQEKNTAILDCDRAIIASPMIDLGKINAYFEREIFRGELTYERKKEIWLDLLDGYIQESPVDMRKIEIYTAIGLLQFTPEEFRCRKNYWGDNIEQLLSRIEQFIGKSLTHTSRQMREFNKPIEEAVTKTVFILDQFNIRGDPEMSFLAHALNPLEAEKNLSYCLFSSINELQTGRLTQYIKKAKNRVCSLNTIRVLRYKPKRRCLIEYDVSLKGEDLPSDVIALIGKVRSRGVDIETYKLHVSLWNNGFGDMSQDHIFIPEPIGIIPQFNMWIYYKIQAVPVTNLLAQKTNILLIRRIAEAAHKIHTLGTKPYRRHSITDELKILHQLLPVLYTENSALEKRIKRLLEKCDMLGEIIQSAELLPVHRDFYPDNILVNGDNIYIVDFDLYCEGDPALDIGNFIGHITEFSLRSTGGADTFVDVERTLEEEFLKLSGEHFRRNVQIYALLTLVRHIYISAHFLERNKFTGDLLELCERRIEEQLIRYR